MARQVGEGPLRVYEESSEGTLRQALASGRPLEWVSRPEDADLTVAAGRPGAASDLTDREAEVLAYLADGWSNEEIADRLSIGVRTVRFHLDRLYRKLGVGRRTEAVREAVTRGYLRF